MDEDGLLHGSEAHDKAVPSRNKMRSFVPVRQHATGLSSCFGFTFHAKPLKRPSLLIEDGKRGQCLKTTSLTSRRSLFSWCVPLSPTIMSRAKVLPISFGPHAWP